MRQWHTILQKVLRHGTYRKDRTGVGTMAVFAESLKFQNTSTFPAVTTKHLAFKQAAGEMACFIRGNHSLDAFHAFGCGVWDGNGNDPKWTNSEGPQFEGDLGRIYGVQWRDWKRPGKESVDQLHELISGLQTNPCGRRHLVTAWNPGELDQMCLPPCPVMWQVYRSEQRIDLCVYQRSCDLFLGLPFDIAGYALLQRLIAKELGCRSGELTFFIGDAHIYMNHVDAVKCVLKRDPNKGPMLLIDPAASLFDFHPSQVKMVDYNPHPPVPALLNV